MGATIAEQDSNPAEARRDARKRLVEAVGQNAAFSLAGFSERVFARLFNGLVYAQIWEDPDVDMAAMALGAGHRVMTIASGGCNALSYLVADPARIEAVDLNPAHVAFNRLKIAALKTLPDHETFFNFYGAGDRSRNVATYDALLADAVDAPTRAYWNARGASGRRRISIFAKNPYRYGLLGRFIGAGHRVARFYGVDLGAFLETRSMAEQRDFFETRIAPIFDRDLVRWAVSRPSTLFGLGIPPQQYAALSEAGPSAMADVLKARLKKLTCDFPLADNYFAWQAFGRSYRTDGPLPPYLQRANYPAIKARAGRVTIVNASFTDLLAAKPASSVDRFVLLDAQDWMSDAQLGALWREITRTAVPEARVIFRTAGEDSILPGRVDEALLARWDYDAAESRAFHDRDRSAIYGGFHLYRLKD